MSELKTRPTRASVKQFIDAIEDEKQRADCRSISKMMSRLSGRRPKMWGESIVGFGTYHYVYASGQEGDWPRVGFSPRKQNLSLYIMPGFKGREKILKKLGKHKTGKSCLYIKRLSDVDVDVLEELVAASLDAMQEQYPE